MSDQEEQEEPGEDMSSQVYLEETLDQLGESRTSQDQQ
jgi:hypothetical protein